MTTVRKAMTSLATYPLKVIQLRQSGRYRGPLVIQTIAQCWIDFDGAVDVPGFIDHDHFPYAALVLSATSVRFPLCMVLNIFMVYRCIMLSGCGPKDASPRRATIMPSLPRAVALSKRGANTAGLQSELTSAKIDWKESVMRTCVMSWLLG